MEPSDLPIDPCAAAARGFPNVGGLRKEREEPRFCLIQSLNQDAAVPQTEHKMERIKLNLAKMSLDEKLQLTQNVITGLDSNATYPSPNPSIVQLTAARTNIIAKTNAISAAEASLRTEFAERADLEAQLVTYLEQEAAYVENASGGDKAKILSSGFPVRGPRVPVGPLSAPQALSLIFGQSEGTVACSWDAVRGASSYVLECTQTENGPWSQVAVTTTSSYIAGGLQSGKKYFFRVQGVGAAGPGAWSEVALKMAA